MNKDVNEQVSLTHNILAGSIQLDFALGDGFNGHYQNTRILVTAFIIGGFLLSGLVMTLSWPSFHKPLHLPLHIQLVNQPLANTELPTSISTPPHLLPANTPLPQALPESFQTDAAPAPTIDEIPTIKNSKENLPPRTEPAQDTLPLKAKIFSPQLRQTLDDLSADTDRRALTELKALDRQIQTYQTQSGDTMVAIEGRCYRVFDDEFSPTGKSWSLPTRCHGHKTESDRISDGLRKAMQERFGQR